MQRGLAMQASETCKQSRPCWTCGREATTFVTESQLTHNGLPDTSNSKNRRKKKWGMSALVNRSAMGIMDYHGWHHFDCWVN